MKLYSRTKCWQVTLRFNCQSNFHLFFKKESAIFRFVIQSDHATFTLKYPDRFYFYIYASSCYFNFFIYFSFGNDIFGILPDFPSNIFFLPYHVCKQFICLFRLPANNLFQYFSSPTPPPRRLLEQKPGLHGLAVSAVQRWRQWWKISNVGRRQN